MSKYGAGSGVLPTPTLSRPQHFLFLVKARERGQRQHQAVGKSLASLTSPTALLWGCVTFYRLRNPSVPHFLTSKMKLAVQTSR